MTRAGMRILFVTSNRIGDAVLSTGLLDHLIRSHPDARFTVACGPDAAGLFTHMPQLDRLIPFEKRRRFLHWPWLWSQVARTRWDLVVDIRGSVLAWMLWNRRRAIMRRSRGHKTAQIADIVKTTPVQNLASEVGPEVAWAKGPIVTLESDTCVCDEARAEFRTVA